MVLSGISFDVENTLLVYNDPQGGDAANYEAAIEAYNAATGEPFCPKPSWQGSSSRRSVAFNEAWEAAEDEFTSLLQTSETQQLWKDHFLVAWGGNVPSVTDSFFQRVCDLYFETSCPSPFVDFLVHTFYVSPAVYRQPRDVDLLLSIREKYPTLPIVIVSNTDARIVRATRMFDEYASVFPVQTFFHASNLPQVKPSPLAITIAAESCGVSGPHAMARWVHVGDDIRADGGGAKAAGCMFFPCDASTGVNFAEFAAFVEAQMGPSA